MPGDKTTVVEVKTGGAAARREDSRPFKTEYYHGPHHNTTYDRHSHGGLQRLQEIHQFIVAEREIGDVRFDGVPAFDSFDALEKACRVDLVLDEQLFLNCPLTTLV